MPVTLPDRVTVLTCIGCGAMGREERCEGACAENRLPLVRAADYDELCDAVRAACARAERLAPVVRELAAGEEKPDDAEAVVTALRDAARRALHEAGPDERHGGWTSPDAVTGWWCHRCGNVDMPQPCIGVCVWLPADWVNLAVYEGRLADLRAARAVSGLAARLAAVTPRRGQWQRNREALREQARAALDAYDAQAPAPEPAVHQRPEPEAAVHVHSWPR